MQRCSSIRTGSSPPTRRPAASPAGSTPRCATCRSSPRTGTCRPTGSPTTSRSATRPRLLISPDHYVTRLLHANGVPLETLGAGGTPLTVGRAAGGLAGAVHPLGRLPRHAEPVLAGERARRDLRRDRAAVRGHRRRDLRPGRGDAGAGPTSGRGRCCSASASRCWPPRTTRATTWPTTRPSATTPRSRTRVLPTFRPDRYLEPGRTDWRGAGRRARRRGRHRHRRLQGLHRRAGGPAPALHRARRRLRRPQPRRRRHRPARPGRRRADLRGGPRGHGDSGARPRRCAATCCWRWRGCRSRTAW